MTTRFEELLMELRREAATAAKEASDTSDIEILSNEFDEAVRRINKGLTKRYNDLVGPKDLVSLVGIKFVVADRIRELRERAGITQEELGDAMRRIGFGWKTATATDMEAARRNVTVEELFGLAALFSVPVLHFLEPGEWETVELPFQGQSQKEPEGWPLNLWGSTLQELAVGPKGRVTKGSKSWVLPRALCHIDDEIRDWRPAAKLKED